MQGPEPRSELQLGALFKDCTSPPATVGLVMLMMLDLPTEIDQDLLHQSGSQKEQGNNWAQQGGDKMASFKRLLSSPFNMSQRTSHKHDSSFIQTSVRLQWGWGAIRAMCFSLPLQQMLATT